MLAGKDLLLAYNTQDVHPYFDICLLTQMQSIAPFPSIISWWN